MSLKEGKGKLLGSGNVNMIEGPVFPRIVVYAMPIMLSGMLQRLYNAADLVVVGRWASSSALAAVGATGSMVMLFVDLFIGLSVGVCVTVAHYYGAGEAEGVSRVVNCAILIGLAAGIVTGALAFFLCGPILRLMGCPEDIMDQAELYSMIVFCGMPATAVYNFGASVLRGMGDSKRPLYYLSVSGLVNVVLNVVLVLGFGMGVEGVAIPTVISETISAVMVVRALMKLEPQYRLDLKNQKYRPEEVKKIVKIGVPAGVEGMMFSIPNMLIQAGLNSFGTVAVAASSASVNLEGFISIALDASTQTSMAFVGQNVGAGQYRRIHKVVGYCMLFMAITSIVFGGIALLLPRQLLSIYTSDQEVIEYGMTRLMIIGPTYIFCGIMDVFVGALRGMDKSFLSMINVTVGTCILRIVWLATVFQKYRMLEVLYVVYPVSWIITSISLAICYFVVLGKLCRREDEGKA
ncbi:MAG: MATE family efflux transporter [Oscillospiraceae bacterium]|jgi:putative MATE family efflux protein